MLLLSRCRGERILIGDDIIIEVVQIRENKVRLGIICPAEIPVHRAELLERIQREMGEIPTPDVGGESGGA